MGYLPEPINVFYNPHSSEEALDIISGLLERQMVFKVYPSQGKKENTRLLIGMRSYSYASFLENKEQILEQAEQIEAEDKRRKEGFLAQISGEEETDSRA